MKSFVIRSGVLLLTLVCSLRAAPPEPVAPAEREAVLAVAQKLFDALAAHDAEGIRALLLPECSIFAIREESGKAVLRHRSTVEFITRLSTSKDKLLERMWDPTVLVHGRIATVWTPYDFHSNDKFSHGGVDVFNLIKTDEGWKVSSLAYTVEPDTTVRHPAGPPPGVK